MKKAVIVCEQCGSEYPAKLVAKGVLDATGHEVYLIEEPPCPVCAPREAVGCLDAELAAEALCNVCDYSNWSDWADGDPIEFDKKDFRRMGGLLVKLMRFALEGTDEKATGLMAYATHLQWERLNESREEAREVLTDFVVDEREGA